ncbi:MAG TPA: hypothetical protein VK193_04875, partial [Methyloceanibacter sp.]|nr:hypothetical protein [Methyloceanibacter sp.]
SWLLSRLQLFGVDIASAMEQRKYIALDAAETLKAVLLNGVLDRERLSKVAGELILGTAKAANLETYRVAACGECVPMLQGEAAIQLERMWNDAIRIYNVEVLCGYSLHKLEGGIGRKLPTRSTRAAALKTKRRRCR